jgi:thiamine monophosphate synthase
VAASADSLVKSREAIKGARLLSVTGPRPDLAGHVKAAFRGGVDVVQLREKRATEQLLSHRRVHAGDRAGGRRGRRAPLVSTGIIAKIYSAREN